ncbi:uncharacterized protein [Aristolochia californica]|uniref:uncharacterized protein n=1 Tax=Aristolochia californica TaxID=171875 RepID=UPI0035DBBAD4
METILNKDTAKHIWDSMKQKYEGSTRVKRAQLQALRKEFEQVMIIEKILRSMTSRFDYVVCSIEESNNLDTLTIDELHSSLLVHEQRMNAHGRGDEQCHQLGDFQYECPQLEKEANYAELEEKEEILLMSYVELNQSRREDIWFIDSGCSNHICANKEWFSNLDEEFRQSVTLGNNSKMAVLGKGNIRLQIVGVTQIWASEFQGSENIAI